MNAAITSRLCRRRADFSAPKCSSAKVMLEMQSPSAWDANCSRKAGGRFFNVGVEHILQHQSDSRSSAAGCMRFRHEVLRCVRYVQEELMPAPPNRADDANLPPLDDLHLMNIVGKSNRLWQPNSLGLIVLEEGRTGHGVMPSMIYGLYIPPVVGHSSRSAASEALPAALSVVRSISGRRSRCTPLRGRPL